MTQYLVVHSIEGFTLLRLTFHCESISWLILKLRSIKLILFADSSLEKNTYAYIVHWLERLRSDIGRVVSSLECAEPNVNYPWESLHQHFLIIIIYDFTCIHFNSIKHSFCVLFIYKCRLNLEIPFPKTLI